MPKDERTPANQQGEQQPQDKIEIVDENLKQGFAQMPRPVLRAKGLSFRAKCIYNLLLDYAWQTDSCFPGQDRLAVDLDTSVDTIQRGLKELKEYRLIDWKQAGLNKPNLYYILKLSDCCFLHPETDLNGKPQKCGIQKPHNCGILTPQDNGTKNTKSKNTQVKNTKSFRKGKAFQTEKGGEGVSADARRHIAYTTTRKRNSEETNETTQESGSPPQKLTPTQKRVATIEKSKQHIPAYIGKPLTQEEIDENRRNNQNASGLTPLSHIIPASHWQKLEARASSHPTTNSNGSSNGGLHYDQTTKHAPLSIDATIEEISYLLLDEKTSIAQNINRAAKLCREAGYQPEQFTDLLWSIYYEKVKPLPDKLVKKKRADGRPNKMLLFFAELEKALGFKPKPPN